MRPLNDEEKAKAETEGLLVTESTGAARKAGIREGDIIVNVNGVKIKKTDDLARVLDKNKNLRVLVQRQQEPACVGAAPRRPHLHSGSSEVIIFS